MASIGHMAVGPFLVRGINGNHIHCVSMSFILTISREYSIFSPWRPHDACCFIPQSPGFSQTLHSSLDVFRGLVQVHHGASSCPAGQPAGLGPKWLWHLEKAKIKSWILQYYPTILGTYLTWLWYLEFWDSPTRGEKNYEILNHDERWWTYQLSGSTLVTKANWGATGPTKLLVSASRKADLLFLEGVDCILIFWWTYDLYLSLYRSGTELE